MHMAESYLNPVSFNVDNATKKLQRYKPPGIDEIPAELIKAGGNTIRSDMYTFINYSSNNEELS
jgi:predicted nucleotide-binding protein (sugar kinase/HSP70/actin superfamily)